MDELAAHPLERLEEALLEDAGEDHLAPVRVGLVVLQTANVAREGRVGLDLEGELPRSVVRGRLASALVGAA